VSDVLIRFTPKQSPRQIGRLLRQKPTRTDRKFIQGLLTNTGSEMIIEDIKAMAKPGVDIPKPEAQAGLIVKGWGKRRGEDALIYFIPNHKNPVRPFQKGVTISEWEKAYARVMSREDFSHQWFKQNLPKCANEGDCNFTTIGGIFILLGIVEYYKRGAYRLLPACSELHHE
jgi:hypothetical protein